MTNLYTHSFPQLPSFPASSAVLVGVYMGASQSTMPESVTGDQLAQRLEELDVQSPQEKGYVYVKSDMETPRTPDSANELPSTAWEPTLSISTAEHWEKELLQDPKVRSILSSLLIRQCLPPMSRLTVRYSTASLSPPSPAPTPSKS